MVASGQDSFERALISFGRQYFDADGESQGDERNVALALVSLPVDESNPSLANIMALPICPGLVTVDPRFDELIAATKSAVSALRSAVPAETTDNLLAHLIDNRISFENVLQFLSKSERHHFLRVMPLPLRKKLLEEFPVLFDNAPSSRTHWDWFSKHWLVRSPSLFFPHASQRG